MNKNYKMYLVNRIKALKKADKTLYTEIEIKHLQEVLNRELEKDK